MYPSLPASRSVYIAPPTINHAISISFPRPDERSPSSRKAKYLFTLPDAQTLSTFRSALDERIARTKEVKGSKVGTSLDIPEEEKHQSASPWNEWEGNALMSGRERWAADLVSHRVLVETLIDNGSGSGAKERQDDDTPKAKARPSGVALAAQGSHGFPMSPARPASQQNRLNSHLSPPPSTLQAYNASTPPKLSARSRSRSQRSDVGDSTSVDKAKTGKDLVLICRQNSLLPVVLGLVKAVSGSGVGLDGDKRMGE